MRRTVIVCGLISTLIPVMLVTLFQPSYFLADPSRYSFFNALVADRGVTVERGIAYGAHPRLKLDIFSPERTVPQDGSPIVVFLYGGTWKEGERSTYGFVGAALAARGITTVIPDYRLFPEARFPVFVEDAAAAYVWTQQHFRAPDGGSRPVIVMGHSAGAHMAAMLAFNSSYITAIDPNAAAPAGLIGLAGPYAFDLTTYETTRELFPHGQDAGKTIPASFVTSAAPPTLLIHGAADTTVKLFNQETLAERLRAAGAPVATHVPEKLNHVGLIRALAWPFRRNSSVIDKVVIFVRKQS